MKLTDDKILKALNSGEPIVRKYVNGEINHEKRISAISTDFLEVTKLADWNGDGNMFEYPLLQVTLEDLNASNWETTKY